MHRYLPHTDTERAAMLAAIGVDDIEALFAGIPAGLRCCQPDMPPAMSELEMTRALKALAAQNANTGDYDCYLGGGYYDRFIPAVVPALVSRQEFMTAYTPYQAEMSQGTLQATFEFQSMMAALMGHDIANASLYDGASAAAEAMLMACRATGRRRLLIAGLADRQTTEVCATYAQCNQIELAFVSHSNGQIDGDVLRAACDDQTAAVLIQSPNACGVIEDIAAAAGIAHGAGALLIVMADPVAHTVLETPGKQGADICVGEGQQLGNPLSFGGPGFGFMTATSALLRRMPGRIVGETADADGSRGFVLTMQAREQHIRREKATSNICSNQALCALTASVYLTVMGPAGLRRVAEQSAQKAHYLYDALLAAGLFAPAFGAPFLYEFALRYTGGSLADWLAHMRDNHILAGIDLSGQHGLDNTLLVAVTEKYDKTRLDDYIAKAVSA